MKDLEATEEVGEDGGAEGMIDGDERTDAIEEEWVGWPASGEATEAGEAREADDRAGTDAGAW